MTRLKESTRPLSGEAQRLAELLAITCSTWNASSAALELMGTATDPRKANRQACYASFLSGMRELSRLGLIDPYGRFSSPQLLPEYLDRYTQSLVDAGHFDRLWQEVIRTGTLRDSGQAERMRMAQCRAAFYLNDVGACITQFDGLAEIGELRLLEPFRPDLFGLLRSELQQIYFAQAAAGAVLRPEMGSQLLSRLRDWLPRQESLHDVTIGPLVDYAIARGDVEMLDRIDQMTRGKHSFVRACQCFLRGDYDAALRAFRADSSAAKSLASRHLPGMLYVFCLLRLRLPEANQEARQMTDRCLRSRVGRHAGLDAVLHAIVMMATEGSARGSAWASLVELSGKSVGAVVASLCGLAWYASERDLGGVAAYAKSETHKILRGLPWFAECLARFAQEHPPEKSNRPPKSPGDAANVSSPTETSSTNVSLPAGVQSLYDCSRALPTWELALLRLAGIGAAQSDASQSEASPASRLIWSLEILDDREFELLPMAQKATKRGGWSKAREIDFGELDRPRANTPRLTAEDQEILAARRGSRFVDDYYSEYDPHFDYSRLLKAMVNHPLIFLNDDFAAPLRFTIETPRLLATKKGEFVRLAIAPAPPSMYGDVDGEFEDVAIAIPQGDRHYSLVAFDKTAQQIQRVIGDGLDIPASESARVLESLQSIAKVVPVFSSVGGEFAEAKTIVGEPRPHVQLHPLGAGLRAEVFVRPCGDHGPFVRLDDGEPQVFAVVNGEAIAAKRARPKEAQAAAKMYAACPALGEAATAEFPTADAALQALLQLQEGARNDLVTLHWPAGESMRIAGQAHASQLKLRITRDNQWFQASGQLQVDPQLSLDMVRLIELLEASAGSSFIQLDDGRFLRLTEQFRRMLGDLNAVGDRAGGALRIPPIRAVALDDLPEVEIDADAQWDECRDRLRSLSRLRPKLPKGLKCELRDYQREGYNWLMRLAEWGVGGCLADDMGLGKTVQAIALLAQRAPAGPALVVAPTSVTHNWIDELQRFAPKLRPILYGEADRAACLAEPGPHDVVVASYGLLNMDAERFQAVTWNTAILDEAQAIKNMATRRSQAAMGLQAGFRLILTGTPIENHLGELWNLFQFINPGLLGSWESFQSRFAGPIERDQCVDTRRRLKRLVQPFLLRRTKDQVLQELPSRTELQLDVELNEAEAAFYEGLRLKALEQLSDAARNTPKSANGARHLQVLAQLMRLRRACCHPKLILPDCNLSSAKLRMFAEVVDDLLANGHKALVFSQFVDHLSILREELDRKGIRYQYLDGSTPAGERKKRVNAFQSGEGDIFLISLKAGGVGLNLTAADYVLHMDPWWNPAVEDQASDRAHRMGQQRPVTIYRFITKGTIEERITKLHASKRDLADSLLEGTEMSSKLSVDELLELLKA